MSLYNMMFGENQLAPLIVRTLGKTEGDFGRFRDAFVADGKICIYTRCGGGNREDYLDVFEQMRDHPNFLEDKDDDFDSTYCTFFFSFPDDFKRELEKINAKEPWDPSERWQKMINALQDPKKHP